jgi:small subunit ribosomal protein S18
MAMMDDDKDIARGPDLNADAGRRRGKKRVCRYCADKTAVIDYKDPQALKYFISERGKVVPRRISGNCARHQRKVQLAIKRARNIALLPFTVTSRADEEASMPANIQVILQQDVDKVGKSGELVRVRPASRATSSSRASSRSRDRRRGQPHRAREGRRPREGREGQEGSARRVADQDRARSPSRIVHKAGEDGVSSARSPRRTSRTRVKAQGRRVDRKTMHLAEPIKRSARTTRSRSSSFRRDGHAQGGSRRQVVDKAQRVTR